MYRSGNALHGKSSHIEEEEEEEEEEAVYIIIIHGKTVEWESREKPCSIKK